MANLYIIGDSHAEGFRYLQKNNLDKRVVITGTCVASGKTAQGLNKTRNREMFATKMKLRMKDKVEYLALQLGETDCGHALWSRMKIHNTSKEEEIKYAIAGLSMLAHELASRTIKNIIFLGPIIPLVTKYPENIPKYLLKRQTINASYQERTKLTLDFCDRMKEEAYKLGYLYTDINKQLIDPTTRLAKLKYRDKQNLHHLGMAISARLWTKSLIALLDE